MNAPMQQQSSQSQQQQQRLTQVQLTYAQKVSSNSNKALAQHSQGAAVMNGGGGGPQSQSRGPMQRAGNVPSSSTSTNPTALPTNVATIGKPGGLNATQSGSAPASRPQAQSHPGQFRMVQTGAVQNPALLQTSALQNYAYPYNYSAMTAQRQKALAAQYAARGAHSRSAAASYGHRASAPATGGRRDFFDRRVQSNVNQAVNRYYNYHPTQHHPVPSPYPANGRYRGRGRGQYPPSYPQRGRGGGAGAGGGRGYSSGYGRGGGRGSYRGSGGRGGPPSYRGRGGGRGGYGQRVQRTGRGKLSEDQMRKYESAADRDVLCWIYENQGQCRYGQKCQWLHLDRDTGQYIPTAYIANSLDQCIPVPKKQEEEETASEQTKEKGADTEEKKEESEDEDAETIDEKKAKFKALIEKKIEKRIKEESERKVDQNEEDNKEDSKEAESEKGDKAKCPPVTSDKKNYGNYGTTFDRFNVCWEFNTFVGCRKGTKCKWAHQYLAKESAHPYTGEKLNGMAVRKFRKSNDI